MAVRTLTYYEVYELARSEKFVSTVQAVVLDRCLYFRDLHQPTVDLGNFATLTSAQRKEYLLARESLRIGAIRDNVGFAREYAVRLFSESVGIDMPPAGDPAWNPQDVTDELVDSLTLTRDAGQVVSIWNIWVMETTDNIQYFVELDAFFHKVRNALQKAAIAASGEDTSTYPQAAVDKRGAFAVQVLADPNGSASSYKYPTGSNGGLSEVSTEADVEFTVNSMYNDFAGVTYADLNP